MKFYQIEAEITNMSADEIREKLKDYEYKRLLATKLAVFLEKHGNACLFYIVSMRNKELIMCAAVARYDAPHLNAEIMAFYATLWRIRNVNIRH